MSSRGKILTAVMCALPVLAPAQSICVPTTTLPIVRAEGITERIGDIILSCSGAAGRSLTANFTVALNADVTNQISSGSLLNGIVLTIDSGSGPQPVLIQPILNGQNAIFYNGVNVPFSAQGTAVLRFSGIRANATLGTPVSANVAVTGANFELTQSQFAVGIPQRGLYVGYSTTLVCAQSGSPLPATINFVNLIEDGTSFASTRVTEGFAGAFQPLAGPANFNAQTGERFIMQYSGFPAGSQLFVPDVVAGSDAVQPTAGGDLELPAWGGTYAPSASGSLLLARVSGANANGAGGSPVFLPGAIGSPAVTFSSVSELSIVNGSAYVVYEVVDGNPSIIETAQFPTFLGLTPDGSRPATETTETTTFAPVSTTTTASSSEPVPRFLAETPPADCTILGDCTSIFGQLSVSTQPIQLKGIAGGATTGTYFYLQNVGGGLMQWTASLSSGASPQAPGWLTLDPYQGVNSTAVQVFASPANLTAGSYTASITINAGMAGSATIPVSFTVAAAPPAMPPGPTITSVLNAASFAAVPAVPGSLSTIMGTGFSGQNLSATFDGEAATILFNNATQINLLVPADLASKSSAQLVVTANGSSSAPQTVALAPFEPAIFAGGILNQDSTPNSASNGAAAGSVIALWATGLSGTGTITGNIAGQDIPVPYYAGPAPGLIGVQQVNLVVPGDLSAMTTQVYVCGSANGSEVCSIPAPLTVN
ncbi:MAG TPA: IPT/TIG domain-containing protein [Bryobacteraceae bacterium]|nr:IPT/TIG domain-containing protein [Bryobacteraceae bacterium]